MYYSMMSHVKDNVKSQKLGIVEMLYNVGHNQSTDFTLVRKKHSLRSSLPMKTAAVHVCTDNSTIKSIVKYARPFMNLHTTSRIRVHCGKFPIIIFLLEFSAGDVRVLLHKQDGPISLVSRSDSSNNCFLQAIIWKFSINSCRMEFRLLRYQLIQVANVAMIFKRFGWNSEGRLNCNNMHT